MSVFEQLAAPFPKEKIHWRAQSVRTDGTAAMALAYLDARDVMDRLDEVCGPEGWQAIHYDCGGKMACKIGLNVYIPDPSKELDMPQWVWKSDGAGETQVEAEKGAFSGALKRAGVMWGIGRYLYALPAPWVPCETYERNGKRIFKKWKEDPWKFCESDLSQGADQNMASAIGKYADKRKEIDDLPKNEQEWQEWADKIKLAIDSCNTVGAVNAVVKGVTARLGALEKAHPKMFENLRDHTQGRREILATPIRDERNMMEAG